MMDLQDFRKKVNEVQELEEALELVKEGICLLYSENNLDKVSRIVEQVLSREKIEDPEALKMLMDSFLEQCRLLGRDLFLVEVLFQENLFIWDWIFLKRLISLGIHGAKVASQIWSSLEKISHGTASQKILKCWFFSANSSNLFLSPIFLILAEVTWVDRVKAAWIRKKKILPPFPRVYGLPR